MKKSIWLVLVLIVFNGQQVMSSEQNPPQLPGRWGQLSPGQYQAYEAQLIDDDISVGEYLELIEERDRPPWGSFVKPLERMRSKAASLPGWSYYYSRLNSWLSQKNLIERPKENGDLYFMLKNNIERLLYAYKNNSSINIEQPERGNVVSVKMNNINDFTTQIVALLTQYCSPFLNTQKRHVRYQRGG